MPCVRSPNVGRTTGRKTLIYRFDEGSKRCSSSGKCDRYRCSPPSTPPSTICSIWSAISTQERISNETEPPPSPSGGNFAPPEKLAVSAEARPVRVSLTTPCALPLNRSCRGILQQGGRLRHQFLCLIQSVHVGTNARNGVVVHMMRN